MLINTRGYDYTDPQTGVSRHVDTTIDTSWLSHGKYNCPMAVYLDCLAGDSGQDDWTGDSDLGESTLRFGKWLVSYDDQGFVEAYKYDTLAEAIAEFDRIAAVFASMDEDDES